MEKVSFLLYQRGLFPVNGLSSRSGSYGLPLNKRSAKTESFQDALSNPLRLGAMALRLEAVAIRLSKLSGAFGNVSSSASGRSKHRRKS